MTAKWSIQLIEIIKFAYECLGYSSDNDKEEEWRVYSEMICSERRIFPKTKDILNK